MAIRNKKSKKPDKPLWLLDKEEIEEQEYIAVPKPQTDLDRKHEDSVEEFVEDSQTETQDFLQAEDSQTDSIEEQQQVVAELENFSEANTDIDLNNFLGYKSDPMDLRTYISDIVRSKRTAKQRVSALRKSFSKEKTRLQRRKGKPK